MIYILYVLFYFIFWLVFCSCAAATEQFLEKITQKENHIIDRFADKLILWGPTKITAFLAIIFLPLTITCAYTCATVEMVVSKFVSFLRTPFKGAVSMKWFLFRSLFLVAFGFTASETQMISRAYQWWNAPPTPPSAEAQKLIASLESAKGWKLNHPESANWPILVSGSTRIDPNGLGRWYQADIWVNGTKCNDHFDSKDLRAINNAAEVCLRKLTAKAMNETVADSK